MADSDSDVAGGGGRLVASFGASGKKRKTARPSPKQKLQTKADVVADTCHLCCMSLDGEIGGGLKNKWFHLRCWHAVRAARRLGDMDEIDSDMVARPAEWRKLVAPLIREEGQQRDRAARDKLRATTVTNKYTVTELIQEDKIFNKRHYKKYMKQWDDRASDSASDSFERLAKAQGGKYRDEATNEMRVATPGHALLRRISGTSLVKKRTAAASGVGSDSDGNGTQRALGQRRGLDGDVGRDRSRASSVRLGRPRDARDPDVSKQNFEGDAHFVKRRCIGKTHPSKASIVDFGSHEAHAQESRRLPLPSSSSGVRRATSGGIVPDSDSSDECDGASDASAGVASVATAARDSARSGMLASAGLSQEDMSLVAFIQAKDACSERAAAILASGVGRKSVRSRVEVAYRKLDSGVLAQLSENPQEHLQRMDEADNSLKAHADTLDKVKADEWAAADEKLKQLIAAVEDSRKKAVLVLAALEFLAEKAAKKEKVRKNTVGYQKTKIERRLLKGGWPKSLAKSLGATLSSSSSPVVPPEVMVNPASFNEKKLTLWRPPASSATADVDAASSGAHVAPQVPAETQHNSPSPPVLTTFSSYMSTLGIVARIAALTKSLEENGAWTGVMGKLESGSGSVSDIATIGQLAELLDQKGSDPWLAGCCPYQCRIGPSVWPLPGCGAMMSLAGTPTCNTTMVALPVAPLLAKGVALADFQSFLGTPAGEEFVQEHSLAVPLAAGEVLWVPYGVVAIPCLTSELDHVDGATFTLVLTIANAKLAMASGAHFKAVAAWNSEYLTRVSGKRAWAARHTFFELFMRAATEG